MSESTKGKRCRYCGCADLRVDHTAQAFGGTVRYCYCRHCGRRHVTLERIVSTSGKHKCINPETRLNEA